MEITKYYVGARDCNGGSDEGPYDNYEQAKAEAQRLGLCVIEYTFEFTDSCVVDDFTPCKD
jgi:hypothetical protein